MSISTGADYVQQVQRNIADLEGNDFTPAQILVMVNEARTRVALDTHCYRQFITDLNTISQQESYLYNGTLGGIRVNAGGANYLSPTITFTGGSGSGATATALVAGGVITNINMTNWGTGYSSNAPPTVVITDGTGTGASASPIILDQVLDILSISVIWGTLREIFGWLPFTGFQAYCRAYSKSFSTPGVYTMHQGILKFFLYPIPDQIYPMEMDIITQPTDLATVSSPETQIMPPWNDAVQFYASHLAVASLQQYEKSLFWLQLYEKRVKQLPATAFSRRMPNPYRTYRSMVRKL